MTLFPLASLFSLPHHKALFISPCLLHVDMENILGGNSNDSYIHTLSLDSVFVFKLRFLPNRVYKPCLGRGDHSLQYSLESDTLGYISFWSCRISMRFGTFCGLRLADIGEGSLASHSIQALSQVILLIIGIFFVTSKCGKFQCLTARAFQLKQT